MSEGSVQHQDAKSGSVAQPRPDLTVPPTFCQYSAGPCDQEFVGTKQLRGLFPYPAEPESLAATIEGAVRLLRFADQKSVWKTWKDLHIGGQIVFCSICKHMRFAGGVVADVTTLNFNLLFEIGFALGLEIPIWPIRDTTFIKDRQSYDELGLLDTVGYLDFQNSETLANALSGTWPPRVIPAPVVGISREAPLYVLKGHIDTEGAVRLLSTLKKSALRFRTVPTKCTQCWRRRVFQQRALRSAPGYLPGSGSSGCKTGMMIRAFRTRCDTTWRSCLSRCEGAVATS